VATYSDAERAQALAALAANDGNLKRTSRQLLIPPRTLRRWRDDPGGGGEIAPQKKALADSLEALAWQLIEWMPDAIPTANLTALATSFGILVDKMRLLRADGPSEAEERLRQEIALGEYLDDPDRELLRGIFERANARRQLALASQSGTDRRPAVLSDGEG